MMKPSWIIGAGLVLWGAVPVEAQESGSIEVGLRSFSARENLTYSELTLERSNWTFRAVGARKSTSVRAGQATLLHGGSDFEQSIRLKPWSGILPQVGISIADTGAQRQQGFLTLRALYEKKRSDGLQLSVEPRALLGPQGFLGVVLGAECERGKQLTLTARLTPILLGKNGVNPSTGAARSVALWELGVRRGPVTLGATNALGSTTGMSLSPSLSGSALFMKVRHNL